MLASMGPRPDGRGKLIARELIAARRRRQWGRGQTAAERKTGVRTAVRTSASMGPRPDGRGKREPRPSARGAVTGVNGAAARRPRKVHLRRQADRRRQRASMGPRPDGRGKPIAGRSLRHRRERQWGRGQTAAERAVRSHMWMCQQASMGPRPDGRGKLRDTLGVNPLKKASMGPRPDGRGKSHPPRPPPVGCWRQWGRGQTAAERTLVGRRFCRYIWRQWGRGQTAAESCQVNRLVLYSVMASMGPRPDGRGKGAPPRRVRRGPPNASMGPRPDGRGKLIIHTIDLTYLSASMGPRPDGRGKHETFWRGPRRRRASMGPRPDGRGKDVSRQCP